MANQEHLNLLIKERMSAWNRWRTLHPEILPDLSKAELQDCDLNNVRLQHANLREANLCETWLSSADLKHANLSGANLSNANLRCTNLSGAIFRGANLSGANFSNALLRDTLFVGVDLSTTKGLDTMQHLGPSSIGLDTIALSKGKIPDAFLRGAGNPETLLASIRKLGEAAFDYPRCFISYSSKDDDFVNHLYADLQNHGVQCWFAPRSLKIGDKFKMEIDEAIKHYDKLIVILSTHSVESGWVEHEVGVARNREGDGKRDIIMPILLEKGAWKSSKDWVKYIKDNRNFIEFIHWKDGHQYSPALKGLLSHLKGRE